MAHRAIALARQTGKLITVGAGTPSLRGSVKVHGVHVRPLPEHESDLVGWIDFLDHVHERGMHHSPGVNDALDMNIVVAMLPVVSHLKECSRKMTKRYEDLEENLQGVIHQAENDTNRNPSASVNSSPGTNFEQMKNNLFKCWQGAKRAIDDEREKSELQRMIADADARRKRMDAALGITSETPREVFRLTPKAEEVFDLNTSEGKIKQYIKSVDSESNASHHLSSMLDYYLRQSPANIPEYGGGAFLVEDRDQANMVRKIQPWILQHRQTPSINVYFVPKTKMVLFETR